MDGLRKTMISDRQTDTSVTTWTNLLSGYRLLLVDFSLSVSMVCVLKMNLTFSLVTGYKIMNYLRYPLGSWYLKYLKQQIMCACWDCTLSTVHRNFALFGPFTFRNWLWIPLFLYVLSPLPWTSYCFSVPDDIGLLCGTKLVPWALEELGYRNFSKHCLTTFHLIVLSHMWKE